MEGSDVTYKENRVHGLSENIVTTEREGKIGDASAHFGQGHVLLYELNAVYEIDCIIVMLLCLASPHAAEHPPNESVTTTSRRTETTKRFSVAKQY